MLVEADAALLDGQAGELVLAQPAAQPLHGEGHGLQHPVAAGVAELDPIAAGDVAQARLELGAGGGGGDRADEAGLDHRPVGLVEPRPQSAEGSDARRVVVGGALVHLDRGSAPPQHPGAAPVVGGQRPPPHRALQGGPPVGGPLRLGAQRGHVVRQRRGELDPGGRDVAGDGEHVLPGRAEVLEPEDTAGASLGVGDTGGAPGRIEPGAGTGPQRVGRQAHPFGGAVPGPAVRPGAQVDVGHGGGDGVGVDRVHGDPEGAHRDRVGPDPAAEVVHGGQARGGEAARVPGGDLDPAGLLQPVSGEEHPGGELAELVGGPGAQPLLGEQRRGPFGGQTSGAQVAGHGDGVGLAVLRQRPQHGLPLGGGQPAHGARVHEQPLSMPDRVPCRVRGRETSLVGIPPPGRERACGGWR